MPSPLTLPLPHLPHVPPPSLASHLHRQSSASKRHNGHQRITQETKYMCALKTTLGTKPQSSHARRRPFRPDAHMWDQTSPTVNSSRWTWQDAPPPGLASRATPGAHSDTSSNTPLTMRTVRDAQEPPVNSTSGQGTRLSTNARQGTSGTTRKDRSTKKQNSVLACLCLPLAGHRTEAPEHQNSLSRHSDNKGRKYRRKST